MADVGVRVTASGTEEAQRALGGVSDSIDKIAESSKKLEAENKKAAESFLGLEKQTAEASEEFNLLSSRAALVGAALGAVGVAVGMHLKDKFLEGFNAVKTLGDEFNNLSMRTGIAVEQLSGGLRLAAETSGSSVEALAQGMVQLNRRIAEAADGTGKTADAFKRLGISVFDSNGILKNAEQLLPEIADAFQRTADGATKSEVAISLGGRAFERLIPLLDQGSGNLNKFHEEAKRAGIVMDKETAEAAAKLNENLRVLNAYGEGFWMQVATPFVEALRRITDQMRIARAEGGLLAQVWQGVKQAALEVAGVGSPKQELPGVLGKLGVVEVQLAQFREEGDSPRTRYNIARLEKQAAVLRAQRDEITARMAAERTASGVLDLGEFGFSTAKPSIALPTPKPEREGRAGRETSDVAEARAVMSELEQRFQAGFGIFSQEEYASALMRLADQWEGNEESKLAISAKAQREYKSLIEKRAREEQSALKQTEREQEQAFREEMQRIGVVRRQDEAEINERKRNQKELRDATLQRIREETSEEERAVQRNVFLSADEKRAKLLAIAEVLRVKQQAYADDKEMVEQLAKDEREILRKAREMEEKETMQFYGRLNNTVSDHLAKFIKGQESFGDAVKAVWGGVGDSLLKMFTDVVAQSINESLLKPLLDPVRETFKGFLSGMAGDLRGWGSEIASVFRMSFSGIGEWLSGLGLDLPEWHMGLRRAEGDHLAWIKQGEAVIPAEWNPFGELKDRLTYEIRSLLGIETPWGLSEEAAALGLGTAPLSTGGTFGDLLTLDAAREAAAASGLNAILGPLSIAGTVYSVMSLITSIMGGGEHRVKPREFGVVFGGSQYGLSQRNFLQGFDSYWNEASYELFQKGGVGGIYDPNRLNRYLGYGNPGDGPVDSLALLLARIEPARVKPFPEEWWVGWKGRVEGIEQQWRENAAAVFAEQERMRTDISGYATGGEGIFTKPSLISVAEMGAEKVTVSPLAGAAHLRRGGGITINVSGVSLMDNYATRKMVYSLQRIGA